MAIPEEQLDTWAKQGSVTQSKNTCDAIRNVLEGADAPYDDKNKTHSCKAPIGTTRTSVPKVMWTS
jgi:hypothetical protein